MHVQSSVKEGGKGSCIQRLRAEHWTRVSGTHWAGQGGQEMKLRPWRGLGQFGP